MNASAKDLKRALVIRQVSDRTPFKSEEIALLMSAGEPMGVLFDLMYEQIEGLQESNKRLNDTATSQQQRADVAAMRAQEYFVRLRDGGLLNKGETF